MLQEPFRMILDSIRIRLFLGFIDIHCGQAPVKHLTVWSDSLRSSGGGHGTRQAGQHRLCPDPGAPAVPLSTLIVISTGQTQAVFRVH